MSNNFAPFGLSQHCGTGSDPTYEQVSAQISGSNAQPIFFGDAIIQSSGYVVQAFPSTAAISGIFVGCRYLSSALRHEVWSNYWPGTGAVGDVTAYIVTDPNARFLVQTNIGAAAGMKYIGQNCQIASGIGNLATGMSGMYISAIDSTATYPFRVVSLYKNPMLTNGSDTSSPFNWLVVAFNNMAMRDIAEFDDQILTGFDGQIITGFDGQTLTGVGT